MEKKHLPCIYSLCGELLPSEQKTYSGGLTDLCMKHRELAQFLLYFIPRIQIVRQAPQLTVPKLGVQ